MNDVLRYEGMYRRTKPLNVFGIPLQSWEFNNNVELHFSDYCTHAELDDAIANNQLKIPKSRTKKIKQLEIFKKWKTGSRGGIKRKR